MTDDDWTHDPVARQRYRFRRETNEDGGEVLHVEGWVDPGGAVPPHVHPAHEERFHVIEGELEITAGRKKVRTGPGESVVAPVGIRHAFRNRGSVPAHMRVEVEPPMELQESIEDFAALGREGYMTRVGPAVFPKGLGGLIRAAMLLERYRDTTLVLSPPRFVQRLLIPRLARLGERRGYETGAGR
jgi:quercetin dioxygenase-like cupin family protein